MKTNKQNSDDVVYSIDLISRMITAIHESNDKKELICKEARQLLGDSQVELQLTKLENRK